MMKNIASFLLAGMMVVSLVGCGAKPNTPTAPTPTPTAPTAPAPAAKLSSLINGTVTASGSTALLPLVQKAKELVEADNTKATITVSGGGSGTGLSQVAAGSVNIGMSDVVPTGDLANAGLVDHKVAVAPFMFITNKDVTATNITADQAAKIFKGEIKNWKDVGGKDAPIAVVARQATSGTRGTVTAVFMNGKDDTTKDAVVKDSTGNVLETVATTPGSIGYIDAPYYKADKVNALQLNGVTYAADAVTSGKWKFYSFEHLYTKGEAKDAAKALIDYMMDADFQTANVEKLGFIPVSKMAK